VSGSKKREEPPSGKPPAPAPTETLWTVADVAEFLKVSKDWVYRRASSRELPSRKVGSHLRFIRAEIVAWLDGQKPR
jgi:excisionase family DNA binding protein